MSDNSIAALALGVAGSAIALAAAALGFVRHVLRRVGSVERTLERSMNPEAEDREDTPRRLPGYPRIPRDD